MNKAFSAPDEAGPGASGKARTISDDWMTIWHSELAAIAVGRELQENWQLLVSIWAGSARAACDAPARQTKTDAGAFGGAVGPTGTDVAAGTTAASASSDAGMDAIERLSRRVDVLERLLAGSSGTGRIRRGRP